MNRPTTLTPTATDEGEAAAAPVSVAPRASVPPPPRVSVPPLRVSAPRSPQTDEVELDDVPATDEAESAAADSSAASEAAAAPSSPLPETAGAEPWRASSRDAPQRLVFGHPSPLGKRPPDVVRGRGWWATVAAATVLTGVLGWVAGGLLRGSPPAPQPPPATKTVATGAFRVTVDGSWRPVAAPAALAAGGVRDAHAFAPIQGAPLTAWIGRARIADPTLLPPGLRGTPAGPTVRPLHTSLGGREAWSYRQFVLGGTLQAVTVVPTSAGSLLVGCSAPAAWSSSVDACMGEVHDVSGAEPLEPRADLVLQRRIPAVVATLNAQRRAGRRALRAARTPRAQARAALRLAGAHARAAARVAPLAPTARPAAELRAVARAYRRLARTAVAPARRRAERFRRARAEVRRSQARLERALARVSG